MMKKRRVLESEAIMLRDLRHPNIVSYFGLFVDSNMNNYIVLEFLAFGSLDRLVQKNKKEIDSLMLIDMSAQIASGMMFLESKHIIHRDLALRNVLVGGQPPSYIIKVADFGLSKNTGEKEYYKSESKTIPYKWCSPEIIDHGLFTHKSDVWAYGITLWELFSYGKRPYKEMSNERAVEQVLKGYRMDPPEDCPIEISKLMTKCWSEKAEDRPSFQNIHSEIIQTMTSLGIAPTTEEPSIEASSPATYEMTGVKKKNPELKKGKTDYQMTGLGEDDTPYEKSLV